MPTKAELQATINDLTRQLKKVKDNLSACHEEISRIKKSEEVARIASGNHYADNLGLKRNLKETQVKLESVSKDNGKLLDQLKHVEDENNKFRKERDELKKELEKIKTEKSCDEAVVLRDEEIDRLKEALDKTSEELQQYKLKSNPIDAEVKLRNKLRKEKEYYEGLLAEKVKENKRLQETCKTLGDQINTANGVAPITRHAHAEPLDTHSKKWRRGEVHPTKGRVPKVPEGYTLAQPGEKLLKGAIACIHHNEWNDVIFVSSKIYMDQPSEKHWYVNPLVRVVTQEEYEALQIPEFTEGNTKIEPSPEMMTFASGAVRSSDAANVRFDLITPVGLRRLAETYKEGSVKYGDNNWQKGFPVSDIMNHAIRHMYLWLDGDKTEDHLAHATWNLMTIMHFEERNPECIDVASRKSTPT